MIGLAEGDAEPVEIDAEPVEANSNRAKVKTNRAETERLCAIKKILHATRKNPFAIITNFRVICFLFSDSLCCFFSCLYS